MLEFRRTWFLEALSCDWQSLFCVRGGKLFVSRCYYFEVVLNAFGWYLQPVVRRELRVRERRASSEETRRERVFQSGVVHFKRH